MLTENNFHFEYPSFYFVWTKKGRVPRFAHPTYEDAEDEAARLAKKHPGRKFIVLHSVVKISAKAESAVEPAICEAM